MTEKQAKSGRADSVRNRREKRARRENKKLPGLVKIPAGKAAPVQKTAHTTPILMRGAKMDVPVKAKKPTKMRRRYDISLGSPGAEVQLPAVPFLNPSWRWLSGLLVLGLTSLLGLMLSYPIFQVQAIEIEGLQRLDAREIHLVLGLQNTPVFFLDPAVMENDLLQAFPEFATAEVHIGLPNNVSIRVDERQPVMGWRNTQGLVLVDATGVSFPARGLVTDSGQDNSGTGQILPVIDAPNLIMAAPEAAEPMQTLNPYVGRQLLTSAQVKALLTISVKAPPNAVLVFDPEHGMGWQDPAGWVVYFGIDGSDISAKLQMYATIVLDLQSQGINPGFISVEFLHAPYYRMERE